MNTSSSSAASPELLNRLRTLADRIGNGDEFLLVLSQVQALGVRFLQLEGLFPDCPLCIALMKQVVSESLSPPGKKKKRSGLQSWVVPFFGGKPRVFYS